MTAKPLSEMSMSVVLTPADLLHKAKYWELQARAAREPFKSEYAGWAQEYRTKYEAIIKDRNP